MNYSPRFQIIIVLCLMITSIHTSLADYHNAEEIIRRVDENMVVQSAFYRAKLVISMGGEMREKKFIGYTRGKENAYIEFTFPARDKGTRFLKLGSEMWMYLPSLERATKIAGHMLRQSLMGSDFSYDDIAENERLLDLYSVELSGVDTFAGKICYILKLQAKVKEVTYYERKIWVDTINYIPWHVEFYAKTGKLLKELTTFEFKKISGHNYPTKIKMVNKLRKETYTEMVIEDIEIDTKIEERIFTKSYLERK
ncbi:MAG: outer membrane lipoprotein-sorting protein [candidate division WOR-3 bacterium]